MQRRRPSWGARANRGIEDMASRVDGQTGEVAQHATAVIVLGLRVLRIPTLLVLIAPIPFIVATLLLALNAEGAGRVIGLVLGLLMAAVSLVFGVRRQRILRAVEEPSALATELGIAVSLSGKVDETRTALTQFAGAGGWRVMSRLRGVWSGVSMTGRWIDEVGDLPRARYFVPPRIGTTVTLAIAALWLVPISAVVALFAVIGSLASAI
ncbi:hypothetical protein [Aeromicrobium sp.]|uniref:hypothetical protein n=1 Tax=Aeromicrobium sp. TaxID=1871063 RepID=UPI003D6AA082